MIDPAEIAEQRAYHRRMIASALGDTRMNERDEIGEAIEQLRGRCEELVRAGLAGGNELARDIDQVHAVWLQRYTVRRSSVVGAFQEAEQCH